MSLAVALRALVHADAILVGSVLAQPVAGREAVWNMLRLTGSIYDTLNFVHETRRRGPRLH